MTLSFPNLLCHQGPGGGAGGMPGPFFRPPTAGSCWTGGLGGAPLSQLLIASANSRGDCNTSSPSLTPFATSTKRLPTNGMMTCLSSIPRGVLTKQEPRIPGDSPGPNTDSIGRRSTFFLDFPHTIVTAALMPGLRPG